MLNLTKRNCKSRSENILTVENNMTLNSTNSTQRNYKLLRISIQQYLEKEPIFPRHFWNPKHGYWSVTLEYSTELKTIQNNSTNSTKITYDSHCFFLLVWKTFKGKYAEDVICKKKEVVRVKVYLELTQKKFNFWWLAKNDKRIACYAARRDISCKIFLFFSWNR